MSESRDVCLKTEEVCLVNDEAFIKKSEEATTPKESKFPWRFSPSKIVVNGTDLEIEEAVKEAKITVGVMPTVPNRMIGFTNVRTGRTKSGGS